jgi:rRNA maturation endonuclease Nob1
MTNKHKRKRCPICDEELSEDDVVCPSCGSCVDEPVYDIEDDLEE